MGSISVSPLNGVHLSLTPCCQDFTGTSLDQAHNGNAANFVSLLAYQSRFLFQRVLNRISLQIPEFHSKPLFCGAMMEGHDIIKKITGTHNTRLFRRPVLPLGVPMLGKDFYD